MSEEKVKIKLNIAGESIILFVPYSKQEATRQTEEQVNSFFNAWRNRFPDKSDRELLAMIAFRYADRYAGLLREREEALRELENIGESLDSALAEG